MKRNMIQHHTPHITCFNEASDSYDDVAHVQKEAAQMLVDHLHTQVRPWVPQSILDLGTGTGYLPELLFPLYPTSHYTLNDAAPNMLEKTRVKFSTLNPPPLTFALGTMETMDFSPHDLIISNLSFQWLQDLPGFTRKLYEKSQVLAFSGLLNHTFQEWANLFDALNLESPVLHHPSETELKAQIGSLNPHRFFWASKTWIVSFETPLAFVQYLKKLGAQYSPKTFSRADLNRVFQIAPHPFSVTYEVYFAILIGPRPLR